MAKILVCENWEVTGRLIAEEAKKDDHTVVVLARDFGGCYVRDNIKSVIKKIQPDYMIIDHSANNCFEVIDIAKRIKPELVSIVHTTHLDVLEEARKRGIPCFAKHSFQEFDNMFKYILDCEKQKLINFSL